MDNRIIYLHGFQSSPDSIKSIELQQYVKAHHAEYKLWIPQLPLEPDLAIQLCINYIDERMELGENITIIGSSLGGFYAVYLAQKYDLNCVVINPALHPDEYIERYKDYLEEIITNLPENWLVSYINVIRSFKVKTLTHPKRFLLLTQTGDELLDYRIAQAYFSDSYAQIDEGGCHNFDGFEKKLPHIFEFLG
ncbi:YqiA/YcfP family alpha/beta fold hydrolase [Marinicellulosiphila megalodicopiae]|uniref:YqiA/YcfP family alpha/beta fold hydrolase n=1 Tax=Marinicellulosiphila megalodicopiae TaxID=2724896 RepID=UPI003BB060AA